MSRVCGACTAAVPDGVTLCAEDVDTLRRTLHQVPAVLTDLMTALSRQDNLRGPGRRIGKSDEKPLLWNDRIPGKVDALTETLTRWARPVARARALVTIPVIPFRRDPKDAARVPDSVSLAELAARVLDHADTLRRLPAAGEAFDEITRAVASARNVVDRPMDRRFLGQCSADVDGVPCPADLYAPPHRATAVCRVCLTEHDVEYRRKVLLAAVHDEVVTYAEAERALPDLLDEPVKTSTLRTWVSEGRLVPEGYRHAGTWTPSRIGYHDPPLLKVGDIVREYARVAAARTEKVAS